MLSARYWSNQVISIHIFLIFRHFRQKIPKFSWKWRIDFRISEIFVKSTSISFVDVNHIVKAVIFNLAELIYQLLWPLVLELAVFQWDSVDRNGTKSVFLEDYRDFLTLLRLNTMEWLIWHLRTCWTAWFWMRREVMSQIDHKKIGTILLFG